MNRPLATLIATTTVAVGCVWSVHYVQARDKTVRRVLSLPPCLSPCVLPSGVIFFPNVPSHDARALLISCPLPPSTPIHQEMRKNIIKEIESDKKARRLAREQKSALTE